MSSLSRVLFPLFELSPWSHVSVSATAVITMASSMMIIRSLFVLVVLAMAAQTNAQCHATRLRVVQATPELSFLYTVIEASGLAMTINVTDNVTVLAPNNYAFNGMNGLLALLKSNDLTLENVTAPGANRAASILMYHILPAPYFTANLSNGLMSPTLLGDKYELTVFTTGNKTFIGAANSATGLVADISVCNSVVHGVLLPASNLTAIPLANTTAAPPGSPPMVTLLLRVCPGSVSSHLGNSSRTAELGEAAESAPSPRGPSPQGFRRPTHSQFQNENVVSLNFAYKLCQIRLPAIFFFSHGELRCCQRRAPRGFQGRCHRPCCIWYSADSCNRSEEVQQRLHTCRAYVQHHRHEEPEGEDGRRSVRGLGHWHPGAHLGGALSNEEAGWLLNLDSPVK